MERISHTLYSDILDEEKLLKICSNSHVAQYLLALDSLDCGDMNGVSHYLETSDENTFFAKHVQARCLMQEGDFKAAEKMLMQLLKADEPLNKVNLYAVICELEICCRENEDFKSAYNYANEKVELLEHLLKET